MTDMTRPSGDNTIRTYTGKWVNPMRLTEDDIDIRDIAFSLANISRFGGHCSFYSVAEHSIYVGYEMLRHTSNATAALAGLLHDASEAYLCDIPRPVKHDPSMEFYRLVEEEVQLTIAGKYGVDGFCRYNTSLLHTVDYEILRWEQTMTRLGIRPAPKHADVYSTFLTLFNTWYTEAARTEEADRAE